MDRTRLLAQQESWVASGQKVASKGVPGGAAPTGYGKKEVGPVEDLVAPTNYQLNILVALNRTGKHIYAGTVTDAEKKRRRKANRVARAQRKVNRG